MADTPPKTEQQQRADLRKIINAARTAFMVTKGGPAGLHGRPMQNADVEDDFTAVWFASGRDSGKIAELQTDSHVFLGYTNASGSEWASINGRARIVSDRAIIRDKWSPIWKNWFTGPDDPKLVLIEVTPESAEYWDSGSQLLQLAKFAIAAVTGKHMSEGEHQKVKL